MAEETYSFDMARVRLEEIAVQVRKKDVSLEKSLDLLEEGVRLANLCTEQIDQTQWRSVVDEASPARDGEPEGAVAAEAEEEPPAEEGRDAAEEDPEGVPDGEA
ncbi:MAG TPA: exodeoxyribonuclease VII small subunit [Coriobacteriia bacterium]|jgi:exodeoxyribonuclease VII small subunit